MHFQVGTAIHLNVRYSDPGAAKNTIRPDCPPTLMQEKPDLSGAGVSSYLLSRRLGLETLYVQFIELAAAI